MSFAKTTDQFRNRTKTVTRRKGWQFLEAGDIVNGCVKCMGLKPGEKIERLGQIRIISVRRESLLKMANPAYGNIEAKREGFPELTGAGFVKMFCDHMGGDPDQEITRIEYEYV